MDKQQFAQLEATITAAIAAGFSAVKSKPESEQEKPEPAKFATETEKTEPQKFATEQQVAELAAKVESLTEAFNQATQKAVTEVPQGEPAKTAFNIPV